VANTHSRLWIDQRIIRFKNHDIPYSASASKKSSKTAKLWCYFSRGNLKWMFLTVFWQFHPTPTKSARTKSIVFFGQFQPRSLFRDITIHQCVLSQSIRLMRGPSQTFVGGFCYWLCLVWHFIVRMSHWQTKQLADIATWLLSCNSCALKSELLLELRIQQNCADVTPSSAHTKAVLRFPRSHTDCTGFDSNRPYKRPSP